MLYQPGALYALCCGMRHTPLPSNVHGLLPPCYCRPSPATAKPEPSLLLLALSSHLPSPATAGPPPPQPAPGQHKPHNNMSSSMRLKAERKGTGAYCSVTNNNANMIAAASNGMTCFMTSKAGR